MKKIFKEVLNSTIQTNKDFVDYRNQIFNILLSVIKNEIEIFKSSALLVVFSNDFYHIPLVTFLESFFSLLKKMVLNLERLTKITLMKYKKKIVLLSEICQRIHGKTKDVFYDCYKIPYETLYKYVQIFIRLFDFGSFIKVLDMKDIKEIESYYLHIQSTLSMFLNDIKIIKFV